MKTLDTIGLVPATFATIPVSQIRLLKENPTSRGPSKKLSNSIEEVGLLNPLKVECIKEGKNPLYGLLDGNCCFTDLVQKGATQVHCLIYKPNGLTRAEIYRHNNYTNSPHAGREKYETYVNNPDFCDPLTLIKMKTKENYFGRERITAGLSPSFKPRLTTSWWQNIYEVVQMFQKQDEPLWGQNFHDWIMSEYEVGSTILIGKLRFYRRTKNLDMIVLTKALTKAIIKKDGEYPLTPSQFALKYLSKHELDNQ